MNRPAIVVIAYKIPKSRLRDFLTWNATEITAADAALYLVCESAYTGERGCRLLDAVYPGDMPVFSICKTGNYGIREAADAGRSPILKTDIDVAFDGSLKTILTVNDWTANVPKYLDCPSYERRKQAKGVLPDGQGSICMTAGNWRMLQGYDERFTGWGGDDNEMCARIKELGIRLDDGMNVCHIAHEVNAKWNRENGFNPRNWQVNHNIPQRRIGMQPLWGTGR
jgi:hypothetical protein